LQFPYRLLYIFQSGMFLQLTTQFSAAQLGQRDVA